MLQGFTCRGIKKCEHTHPDLINTSHTQLDDNWSLVLERYHTAAFQSNPDIPNARVTEELYQYHINKYEQEGCSPRGLCSTNYGLKLIHIKRLVGLKPVSI